MIFTEKELKAFEDLYKIVYTDFVTFKERVSAVVTRINNDADKQKTCFGKLLNTSIEAAGIEVKAYTDKASLSPRIPFGRRNASLLVPGEVVTFNFNGHSGLSFVCVVATVQEGSIKLHKLYDSPDFEFWLNTEGAAFDEWCQGVNSKASKLEGLTINSTYLLC